MAAKDKRVGVPPPKRLVWADFHTNHETTVSELIDKEHLCWRKNFVRKNFDGETDRILAMPISHRLPPDHLVS